MSFENNYGARARNDGNGRRTFPRDGVIIRGDSGTRFTETGNLFDAVVSIKITVVPRVRRRSKFVNTIPCPVGGEMENAEQLRFLFIRARAFARTDFGKSKKRDRR